MLVAEQIIELENIIEGKSTLARMQQLNQLSESLHIPAPLEKKLNIICDGVVNIFQADFCRIWLTRPGDLCDNGCTHAEPTQYHHRCQMRTCCLHLIASAGRYTHTSGGQHMRIPLGCYKIGMIAQGNGTKFLTNNVVQDKQVHNNKWAKELGLVAFAGYRLVSAAGKTKGVLALFSKNPITPEENLLLEGIADTTANIICSEQTNEALQDSEKRLRTFFESATIGMVIVDLNNPPSGPNRVQYNPAAQKFLGYSHKELEHKNIADISHPEDLDKDLALFDDLVAGKRSSYETEKRYIRKDGKIVWARLNLSLLQDKIENKKYSLATLIDITERKQAEEDLKLFRYLIDQSNDAIFVIDPKTGKFLDVNQHACKMLKYPCQELLTLGIDEIEINNPELHSWEEYIKKIRREGHLIVEGVQKRKDGTRFPVEMSIKYITHAKQDYLVALGRDITRRKKMEKKMTTLLTKVIKAKQEWEMTFDTTIELVVIVNRFHKIIRCNKSFAGFVGKATQELLGKNCYAYLRCDTSKLEECKQHQPVEKTIAIDDKNGLSHWFYLNCRPIKDKSGKFLYTVIACTDITDLKETTNRLIESKKELNNRVDELEKFYEMAVGRELKMKELKEEIKKLRHELKAYQVNDEQIP
ncbi:MAG: PAS domain S-box protein [Candidatus Schekmanbacteria bacterium]|nr:PAS domain S-box protein [Candidatus Schekmanbacteria bacterium]